MSSFFGLSWLSYFLTGVIALVVSTLFTGCVFGNNEVDQTVAWDGVTGYYDTQLQSVQLCVTFAGSSTPVCATGGPDQVPSGISSSFTDPLALKLEDSSGDTTFFDPTSTSGEGLNLVVNSTSLAISAPSGDTPNTYQAWPTDSTCSETDNESVSGQITRYTGPAHTVDGNTITGRVGLTYQNSAAFGSTCANALTLITSCYENVADCGGSGAEQQEEDGALQQSLESLFSTLISPAVDLGLVSLTTGSGAPANSVANVANLTLTVSYH